jgi:hypothetical protein
MERETKKTDVSFNLAYSKAKNGMIATNESALASQFQNYLQLFNKKIKYTVAEI